MSRRPTLLLAVICILGISSMACGLFDREDLDITYTADFSFDIPLDAGELCPDGVDCTSMAIESPEDRELLPISIAQNIDIVAKSGKPELADYAGRFKSINITKIEYTVEDNNSLTFDIPAANVYLGPLDAKETTTDGVLKMATLPTVPAKMAGTFDASIDPKTKDGVSTLIKSLQTSALVEATPVVKKGQPFPPSGKANLKVTLFVTFVANPADAISKD